MHAFFYLSFCVLNGVSFILLIYYFFKCTSLINKSIGIIPAIIFFLGAPTLLSSFTTSEIPEKSNHITLNNPLNAGGWQHKYTVIDDKQFARLIMSLHYQELNKSQPPLLLSAGSSLNGLVGGVKWNQKSIDFIPTANNSIQYYISGEYKWSFLGINIYTQSKRFEGKIVWK